MTRPEPARLPSVPEVDYRGSREWLSWMDITAQDFPAAEPPSTQTRLNGATQKKRNET